MMAQARSEIRVESLLGFLDEIETPVTVFADATERGECRIEMRPNADYLSKADRRRLTAYLTPTDAAIIGAQLIAASREATAPPDEG